VSSGNIVDLCKLIEHENVSVCVYSIQEHFDFLNRKAVRKDELILNVTSNLKVIPSFSEYLFTDNELTHMIRSRDQSVGGRIG